MKSIKILVFDNVELLDFAGPLEVFGVAKYLDEELGLEVKTIGLKDRIRVSKTGLEVIVDEVSNTGEIDLLIIPGGIGTRSIIKNETELARINNIIKVSKIVASVCSGALILAKLGYLKGLKAITHKGAIDELLSIDSTIVIERSERFVDNECLLTSAGISAGIDMSLHLVEKYFGSALRQSVQNYMEYDVIPLV